MLNKIMKWLEMVGTARAIGELNRNGHFELIKKIKSENR